MMAMFAELCLICTCLRGGLRCADDIIEGPVIANALAAADRRALTGVLFFKEVRWGNARIDCSILVDAIKVVFQNTPCSVLDELLVDPDCSKVMLYYCSDRRMFVYSSKWCIT
jgi:hypothetical protein